MLIEISDEALDCLKKYAEPLVDDASSAIIKMSKILAQSSANASSQDSRYESFDPANPPSLKFAVPVEIVLNEKPFRSRLEWNKLMNSVIAEAGDKLSTSAISDLLKANHEIGIHKGPGFNYIEEANISVQGQNAENCWKSIYALANAARLSLTVRFKWAKNEKAFHPGAFGEMTI